MATISGLRLNFSGIKSLPIGASHTKLPTWNHSHDSYRFNKFRCSIALFPRKIPNPPVQYIHLRCSRTTHILSSERNYQLDYNDDGRMDPFWLNIIRDAIWTVRGLFVFLVEQPSQLKYIEWPSFQSTLARPLGSDSRFRFYSAWTRRLLLRPASSSTPASAIPGLGGSFTELLLGYDDDLGA